MFRGFFKAIRDELAGPPRWDYRVQARHITGAHAALAFCNVFPVVVRHTELGGNDIGGVTIGFSSSLSEDAQRMLSWYGKLSRHVPD